MKQIWNSAKRLITYTWGNVSGIDRKRGFLSLSQVVLIMIHYHRRYGGYGSGWGKS